jgi:hypothetical protein
MRTFLTIILALKTAIVTINSLFYGRIGVEYYVKEEGLYA